MSFWRFEEANDDSQTATLYIDGEIVTEEDWWTGTAIVARDFRRALGKYRDVTVCISSPGGDVMAGAEMYTAIREHSRQGLGKVTVKVTGIAASAASVVAMAGDEILISPVAYMMIHKPWSAMAGDADAMEAAAETLRVVEEGILNAYEQRTGLNRDEIREMMAAETYMNAQQCVDLGFADGILYASPEEAQREQGKPRRASQIAMASYTTAKYMAAVRAHQTGRPGQEGGGDPEDDAGRRHEIGRRAAILGDSVAAMTAAEETNRNA